MVQAAQNWIKFIFSLFHCIHIFIFSLFTCPGYGSPHNKAYDTEYALAALQNQVFFEERSRYQPINQGVIINQSTNLKTSDVFSVEIW